MVLVLMFCLLWGSSVHAQASAADKAAAEALLADDPELDRHPALKKSLRDAADRVHLE